MHSGGLNGRRSAALALPAALMTAQAATARAGHVQIPPLLPTLPGPVHPTHPTTPLLHKPEPNERERQAARPLIHLIICASQPMQFLCVWFCGRATSCPPVPPTSRGDAIYYARLLCTYLPTLLCSLN